MHLLRPNGETNESLALIFNMMHAYRSSNPRSKVPYSLLQTSIVYELGPLLEFCIDHPHLKDLLLFSVPFHEHPWGVNVFLCNREN
jgi:hypothetical protein